MNFDYSKLKGVIREKIGTQGEFAKKIGISSTSLYDRLSGKVPFTQSEMLRSMIVLNEPKSRINEIFFTEEIRKTE